MKKLISLMISAILLLSVFSLSVLAEEQSSDFTDDECPHESVAWWQISDGCALVCEECGEMLSEEQEHDWQFYEGPEAECDMPGWGQNFCSRCGCMGSIVETEPALGHNFVNGVCTRCGEQETFIVENEGVTVFSEIKEGTAEINEITVKNTEEKSDIVLDFSTEEDVKSVKLSPAAIDSVSENVKDKLEIQFKNADIVMDYKTVAAIAGAESTGGVEFVVSEFKNDKLTKEQIEAIGEKSIDKILNFEIVSDNGSIHEFNGGKVTVSFPFECKANVDYTVCYIGSDGKLEVMPTKVKNGKIIFETTHFSTFVLLSSTNVTSPDTGDSFSVLPVIALFASLACIAIIVKKKHSFVG